jgi:RNA polymerase sigma factor (sigma-70 family)
MAIEKLGAALRQINRLFADGVVAGLSDAQLLERFLAHGDTAAFEALVGRHGPMVLSVCRGILRDPHDAEDAFQATFLVLVKNGGAIRGRDALGGWLHQVAHRVANQANVAAARRRRLERQVGQMAVATSTNGPAASDELIPALHEEIARLPEKYRLAVVHCDLEGMTQAQAAGQLHWSRRTLQLRLAEGRARLRRRLARRGLAPDGAALGAALLREAQAAVPVAWREATIRAALDLLNPTGAAGAVSVAAQSLTDEVFKTMFVHKLAMASAGLLGAGLMAWAAAAALTTQGDQPPKAATARVDQRAAPMPRPDAQTDLLDETGTLPIRGRVLDPDGRPVAGVAIHVWRHYSEDAWNHSDQVTHGQRGRVAVSGPDGRFHFELDRSPSDFPYYDYPVWHEAKIAAGAPGYGPAWIVAGSLLKGGEATLQLVRDDVPIRGRVVDLQGRPIAGVTVRAYWIFAVNAGIDPGSLIAAGEFQDNKATSYYGDPTWLGRHGTWTTDADGRFEVRGVGRDRIIWLGLNGPGLAHLEAYAMARPRQTQTPKLRQQPSGKSSAMMLISGSEPPPPLYGATFELIIGPSKPIIGVVRIKGTGRPAAGITVRGIEPTTGTWIYATADQDGRFRILGLPKAGVYVLNAEARSGVEPYLNAPPFTVGDTEGLKPIETTIEVPRGMIITGRLIDQATGRPVRAAHVKYIKLPKNPNDGYPGTGHSGAVVTTFKMTVPPGEGLIYANVRGEETPYTRARLRKDDKGKGIGGPGDGEASTITLNFYHAYKFIDVPADARDFTVDLELTRGLTRKGRVVDLDGKPVAGARCYGLVSTGSFIKALPDATFEVHGLEPGYPRQVIFAHKGRRLVGAVTLKDEDFKSEAPLEVRLGPPCSVKGRLVDEDGLPLAGATLSVMSYDGPGGYDSLPSYPGALWPDGETFTADSDGRFEVTGLKPGVRCFIDVHIKARPNTRINTGQVFRDIVPERFGEVRDVGEVKVKVAAE